MATVALDQVAPLVTPEIAKQLRLALREAVNKAALEITEDARARTRLVAGADQRLSGAPLKTSAAPGGRRVNPAYKPAMSVEHPTAIIGARGPMHWLEHDRKGGYDIRPRRARAASNEAVADLDAMLSDVFGTARTRGPARRTKHAPALSIGGKFFGAATGGSISRPLGGPMAGAMRAAPATVRGLVERSLNEQMARTMRSF